MLAALISTFDFWLLWFIFSVLNGVSFVLLSGTPPTLLVNHQSAERSSWLILFFSTIESISVVQSFSLKIADYKPIDLDTTFQEFRASVLTDAASKRGFEERKSAIGLATNLETYYTANPGIINGDYATLITFGGRAPATITAGIASAATDPLGPIQTFVNKMVLTDVESARGFLFLPRK